MDSKKPLTFACAKEVDTTEKMPIPLPDKIISSNSCSPPGFTLRGTSGTIGSLNRPVSLRCLLSLQPLGSLAEFVDS
jgi:hypothetical protein